MENELFSKSEEALMNFMWDHGKPISVAQISELWEGKDITDHHLRVLLRSLEKKSAIECCGAADGDELEYAMDLTKPAGDRAATAR